MNDHFPKQSRLQTPRRVRVSGQSDNLTLIPASSLPYLPKWQRIANSLPCDAVLLVVPNDEGALRRIARKLAAAVASQGRQVEIVATDDPVARHRLLH